MRISILSPADLGLAIRAARRASDVRLDDLAATAGVSKQFTSDVEHGKPTVRLGLVFKLLSELGVRLELDIAEDAARELTTLRARQAVPPAGKRSRRRSEPISSFPTCSSASRAVDALTSQRYPLRRK